MGTVRIAAGKNVSADEGGDIEGSAATLFTIVWDTLAEVLGTAAVAALVRRAAKHAAATSPELVELLIFREDLEYGYTLPHTWSQKTERGAIALQPLVTEIGRLLVELTGTVVIQRLEQIPALHASGLVWRTGAVN
jgi:hypothetical protein